jgi:hypothetical protein
LVRGYGSWDDDSGSAARFFYCAKASKKDRNEGLDGFEEKRNPDGADQMDIGTVMKLVREVSQSTKPTIIQR